MLIEHLFSCTISAMRYCRYTQVAFATLLFLFVTFASAAELIVVEADNCPYCKKFNREIAPAYTNTAEGQQAPLRRVWLNEQWPDDLKGLTLAKYTPTFILVHDGREVDRLVGYRGDEYFWFLLNKMLEKL